ncbi:T9SS type A sorting domain-containing protein [Flavobacterium sp. CS20]|uniref:T9SS type A sorting domain-containing protein n=1 Tax=Flavobacterium sp. CS20 TaxID=2775246 RepID=UPI001B3A657C|nr:T9SS type A sorting domain-containing protein [Flavobacterium sp. CS20]QTY26935.1 T9SS type A sorting domain-containing protein [Flavobacterium sp. CS20]
MKIKLQGFGVYLKTILLHMKVFLCLMFVTVFYTNTVLAQTTYNGNGNSGFGDVVGSSTLEFSDDGTTITGVFTKGSGDFNDAMVVYISTGAAGRSVIDGTVNDQGDNLRRAISSAGTDASDITFPPGFQATHAIAIDVTFGGLWSIPSSGSVGDNGLVYIKTVGNPANTTSASFTFSFDWSDIGLTGSDKFEFVITYLNPSNGFLSDEGYGDGLPTGNPGSANVTFTGFRNYPNYYVYNGTSWTPSNPDGVTQTARDASVESGNATLSNNTSLRDFTIETGAELNIGSSAVLNLSGNILNDGRFIFKSDASGSAQLGQFNGTMSGSGNYTTERFIPAGNNNRRVFRFLASPVNTANSIRMNWQEGALSNTDNPDPGFGTHITGSTVDGQNGFDGTISGNPSLLVFDNATQTWSSIDNTDVNSLQVGNGYNLFVRGDRSVDLTSASQTPTNTTLRATGSLVIGNVDLSADLASGDSEWSLLGNPYQAIVDFNAITFTGDINTNNLYIWNPNASTEGAYEIIDNTVPAQQMIQPGQSFFVQNSATVTTAPGIVYTEVAKNPSGMVTNVFDNSQIAIADLELFNSNNIKLDVLKFRFESGANNGIDDFDGGKLSNPTENLASENSNTILGIERRDIPQDNEIIPLFVNQYQFTQYELRLSLSNWDDNIDVYIVDSYLDTETLIDANQAYSFSVDSSIPESVASDRFSLKFDNTTLSVNDNTFAEGFSLYPNPSKDGMFSIKTQGLNSDNVQVKVYNLSGQEVLNQGFKTQPNGEVNINASILSTGVYLVELIQANQSFKSKIIIQ